LIFFSSKIFSRSSCRDDARVNSSVALFDFATPGTLPVLNKSAVLQAIKTAIILNCKIPYQSRFERKHYFYADMPAGYQITQQRNPFALDGHFDFFIHSNSKRLNIARIQLEIDSGKTIHDLINNRSLIDFNRFIAAFFAFLILFISIFFTFMNLKIFKDTILEGNYRVDANVSLNRKGSNDLGVRTEIKNLNSLKLIYAAINNELNRQFAILKNGGTVVNETLAVDNKGYTVPMRDKEIETDYRFMPEPNLPAVKLDKRWIAEARSSIVKPQFLHYIENFGMDPDAALRIAVIIFLHVISNFVHKFKYMLQIYVYRFIQLKTRQFENLWQITNPEEINGVVQKVFLDNPSIVKKALAKTSPKHVTKLRNIVIAESNKRIEVEKAYQAVVKNLNNILQ
uniref:GatB_N domain-containing protein n=1 Tax=Dracunculus medinensis TaxID=318479 RepID=A0A0N4U9X6_DRAME